MNEVEGKEKPLGRYVVGAIALIVIGLLFLALGLPRIETYTEMVPIQVTKKTEWNVTWYTFTPEGKWGAPVGYSTFPATFTYNWDKGKVYEDYGDYICFIATAIINVPRSGPVSFTIGSDDGSKLYIDGQEVIDLWWDHGYITKTAVVNLTPGKHTLTLYYYERTVNAMVSFTADSDVLTWQETEYQQVTRQKITSNPASLALGIILIIIGGIIVGEVFLIRSRKR
jgi:uncharacterized membrane protein YidH (DUF202 family)